MKNRKYDWFTIFAHLIITFSWVWASFLTAREFMNTDIIGIKILLASLFVIVFCGLGIIVVFGIFKDWIYMAKNKGFPWN